MNFRNLPGQGKTDVLEEEKMKENQENAQNYIFNLQYPFDASLILKKRKVIKKQLKSRNISCLKKKIAILGGSTTHDVKEILELFLLWYGIEPVFYESDYARYWQEVMFDSERLAEFAPDLIYIHTTARNIVDFPAVKDSADKIDWLLEQVYQSFERMWQKIAQTYHCPVIQNNFELSCYRLLGNKDVSDIHGRVNFINRLNQQFCLYAQTHKNFYIQDIHYLASCYGVQKWADPFYWHMYKYALALPAIPELAYNLANMIKSIYGKNKKVLVLDLDNTLWGGTIGEDGSDQIEIGPETAMGQVYLAFQKYIKAYKELGVMLAVNSKNEKENAIAGLKHPGCLLKTDDFLIMKANWTSKDQNMIQIAKELNVGIDSLVFVDDNPAERHMVRMQVPEAAVPEMSIPEQYIQILDRSGFFEVTDFSEEDLKRNDMYQENVARQKQEAAFDNYKDYLYSLEMKAEIKPFCSAYLPRIVQLTNKSNQFNLTTRRCSLAEMEEVVKDPDSITLYGKLEDRFGDNGVVSVLFGHVDSDRREQFHVDLCLMSCRVLKREMEYAMMDGLVKECQKREIREIIGYYYPTAKNKMVKEFYADMKFEKISESETKDTIWRLDLSQGYKQKNQVIQVMEK